MYNKYIQNDLLFIILKRSIKSLRILSPEDKDFNIINNYQI